MMYKALVEGTENCTLKELTDRLNLLLEEGYGDCPVRDCEDYLHGDIGAEWEYYQKNPPKNEATIVIC